MARSLPFLRVSPRTLPRLCRVALAATCLSGGLFAAISAGIVPGTTGGVAHADNELVNSSPADGSSLGVSPTSIVLTFAAPIGTSNTVLTTCNGVQFSTGLPALGVDRLSLTVAVVNPMPKGECKVTYIVSGVDNTPNGSDTFGFTITADPPAGSATTSSTPPDTAAGSTISTNTTLAPTTVPGGQISEPPRVAGPLGLARLLASIGLAALLGSLVLIAVAWPEGIEYILTVRFLRGAWFVAMVGNVLTVVFATAQATGRSIGGSLSPTTWADLTDSTPGLAVLARLGLTTACIWTVLRPERCIDSATQLPAMALPILAVATYGFTRTGGDLAAVGVLAGIAHALAMSIWLGGLLLLTRVVLTGPGEDDLVHAVRGFSRLATPMLIITILSGLVQVWRLDRGALLDTGHGRVLLLKVLVVLAMMFVGFATRQFVRTTVHRTDVLTAALAARLRRATGIEAAGGAVVLALSAWLLALAPGGIGGTTVDTTSYATQTRIASLDLDVTISITGQVGENGVKVEVVQPTSGMSSMVITFLPPDGTAAHPVQLTMPAELAGAGVAVLPQSEGVPLEVAGTWTIELSTVTPAGPQVIRKTFFLLA